jgi:hypothetical protein
MFSQTINEVREAIYGVMGFSQVGPGRVNFSTGTAFIVSPGILVTAAHLCHVETNPDNAVHSRFEVIRAPDIGGRMVDVEFVAEDQELDIAILRLAGESPDVRLELKQDSVSVGTPCGSLGFPLSSVAVAQNQRMFNLVLRFQGAYISSFQTMRSPSGRELAFYETDSLMYKGSSGCPGFLHDGRCFGLHNRSRVERPTTGGTGPLPGTDTRLAISLWVPSMTIREFLATQGTEL